MDYINELEHKELVNILEELLQTIAIMRKSNKSYILIQNENEAKDWLNYLKEHYDKEELDSLDREIAKRLVYKFDVQIERSELDKRRVELMDKYLIKSHKILES